MELILRELIVVDICTDQLVRFYMKLAFPCSYVQRKIHRDLQLKCFKRHGTQLLSAAICVTHLADKQSYRLK